MSLKRDIQELIQIMREEDLAEIEVRRWFSSVRVRRPMAEQALIHAAAPALAAQAPAAREAEASPESQLTPIKSPMVGTFYAKPNPESPPYVTVGAKVSPRE